MRTLRAHKALTAIVASFVLLSTLYSVVTPPFEAPDELWHYAFVQHLVVNRSLPVSAPQTTEMWRQQGGQPPLYYLLAAFVTAPVPQRDFAALFRQTNPHAAIGVPGTPANLNMMTHDPRGGWPASGALLAVHAARLLSVFLGAVTLTALFATLRPLIGDERALWGTAFWAFIPQVLYISGMVTNDVMINASAALVLWRLVDYLQPRSVDRPGRNALIIGMLIGIALLSKISALWLIPLALVAWRMRRKQYGAAAAPLTQLLLILGMALLISGWWFVRNVVLYGDLFATHLWLQNIDLRDSPLPYLVDRAELIGLERSFWGLFGWFNLPYPNVIYTLFRMLSVILLLGLIRVGWGYLRRGRWSVASPRRAGMLILALWPLMLGLSWLAFMWVAPAGQGRYFQPAAPSIALFAVIALSAWPRWRLVSASVVGALFLLALLTPLLLIRPAYAASPLLTQLPANATASRVTYGTMALEGYTAEINAEGDPRYLDLTLYWRTNAPLPSNRSLSVKILGENWINFGQVDSYPDGGRWPTLYWPSDGLLTDRYRVPIIAPEAAGEVQAVARVTLDIYDYDTGEPFLADVNGYPVDPLNLFFLNIEPQRIEIVPPFAYSVRALPIVAKVRDHTIAVQFQWDVGQMLGRDYQAFLHLVVLGDELPLAFGDFTPMDGDPPTSTWWFGTTYRDQAELSLPTDLPVGRYELITGLYALDSLQRVEGEPGVTRWTLANLSWDGRRWQVTP